MSCRAKCATAPWSMCDHVRSVTHPNGPTSQQKEFLKLEKKKRDNTSRPKKKTSHTEDGSNFHHPPKTTFVGLSGDSNNPQGLRNVVPRPASETGHCGNPSSATL